MPLPKRQDLFRVNSITVRRKVEGYFADGEFHEPPPVEIKDVRCNVQPYIMAQKRVPLPEGFRIEDCIVIRSPDFQIRTTDMYSKTNADIIVFKGIEYEAYQQQDWSHFGLYTDHYLVLAVRRDMLRSVDGQSDN